MLGRTSRAHLSIGLLASFVGVLGLAGALNVLTFGEQAARKPEAAVPAQWSPRPDSLNDLSWRFVGPQGNRVSAVVCDSNDPNVYYAGACAGGV